MNKRIRVLETIRQGLVGGGESHLLSLIENMDKNRFEPVVLSFTEGPMVDKLRAMGITTEVIYTERPFDISKWGKVRKFIRDQKIQLVHAHGTRAASNIFWGTKREKLPLVYTIHGWSFHDDQPGIVKNIRVLGEKLLTKKANVNISVSYSNQRTGMKNFEGFKSVVIPNGIDQNKFNPEKSFKDIRQELGYTPDDVIVLFVARFIHQKQPLRLIRAFHRAEQEFPQLKLLMVGDGDQKEDAKALIKELGIENKVNLIPFRNDVPDVLAAGDIYVLPSLWEGLPIGLLEAMAMGKAIIATKVDGTSEVMEHYYTGIMLDVNDQLEVKLAKAILEFCYDPLLRKRMGRQARGVISDTFSADRMTRKIEEIYDQLVNKSPNRITISF